MFQIGGKPSTWFPLVGLVELGVLRILLQVDVRSQSYFSKLTKKHTEMTCSTEMKFEDQVYFRLVDFLIEKRFQTRSQVQVNSVSEGRVLLPHQNYWQRAVNRQPGFRANNSWSRSTPLDDFSLIFEISKKIAIFAKNADPIELFHGIIIRLFY